MADEYHSRLMFLERPEDTERAGISVARLYVRLCAESQSTHPMVILLDSKNKLGAGKSLLARSFIRFLTGVQNVPSPSYLYMLEYEFDLRRISSDFAEHQTQTISHIDTWRLKRNKSLDSVISFDDLVEKKSVILIEHPDRAADLIERFDPKFVLHLTIEAGEAGLVGLGRRLTIQTIGDSVYPIDLIGSPEFEAIELNDPSNADPNFASSITRSEGIVPSELISDLQSRTPSNLLVMGIETSCDDTCVAIIDGEGRIIANERVSQGDIHAQFGGVNPREAGIAHESAIDSCVENAMEALNALGAEYEDRIPDAIAYTIGPGLELCLSIGVRKALELSHKWDIPLIPTNHLESHIAICRLPTLINSFGDSIEYPFVAAVVSGGHTFIALAESPGSYRLLANTANDSIGESGDKIGRMLGITEVPAGPHLEKLAEKGDPSRLQNVVFRKSAPRKSDGILLLSFSNYKQHCNRAISEHVDENDQNDEGTISTDSANSSGSGQYDFSKGISKGEVPVDPEFAADVAASFQEEVTNYFVRALRRSLGEIGNSITQVVVAGGFSANKVFRSKLDSLANELQVRIYYPPISLCTDNGVMVAQNGVEKIKAGYIDPPMSSFDPDEKYEVRSRWPLTK